MFVFKTSPLKGAARTAHFNTALCYCAPAACSQSRRSCWTPASASSRHTRRLPVGRRTRRVASRVAGCPPPWRCARVCCRRRARPLRATRDGIRMRKPSLASPRLASRRVTRPAAQMEDAAKSKAPGVRSYVQLFDRLPEVRARMRIRSSPLAYRRLALVVPLVWFCPCALPPTADVHRLLPLCRPAVPPLAHPHAHVRRPRRKSRSSTSSCATSCARCSRRTKSRTTRASRSTS